MSAKKSYADTEKYELNWILNVSYVSKIKLNYRQVANFLLKESHTYNKQAFNYNDTRTVLTEWHFSSLGICGNLGYKPIQQQPNELKYYYLIIVNVLDNIPVSS